MNEIKITNERVVKQCLKCPTKLNSVENRHIHFKDISGQEITQLLADDKTEEIIVDIEIQK